MSVNEKMTAIADAIRNKTGSTTPLTLDQMAAAIAGIESDSTLEHLTVTENGEYTPGDGLDGFDRVTVEVKGSSGAFTPQTGSFTPAAADAKIEILVKEDIGDNFVVTQMVHDPDSLTLINLGLVFEVVYFIDGVKTGFRASSNSSNFAPATNRAFPSNNAATAYDPLTRKLTLSARTMSNYYTVQYDYCITPAAGLPIGGLL